MYGYDFMLLNSYAKYQNFFQHNACLSCKLFPVVVDRSNWNPFEGLGKASTGRAIAGALQQTLLHPETGLLQFQCIWDKKARRLSA